jgi:hypothetical protein
VAGSFGRNEVTLLRTLVFGPVDCFDDEALCFARVAPANERCPLADDTSLIEIAYAVVRGKLKLSQLQLVVLKELLPTVLPKLRAVATTFVDGKDFASMLDRAIGRSAPAKMMS